MSTVWNKCDMRQSITTCFFRNFIRFPNDVRRGYFLFLFLFIYVIPLVFITATCLSITRVLMQKIPVDPGTDPRTVSLERGRRKVWSWIKILFMQLTSFMAHFNLTDALYNSHWSLVVKIQISRSIKIYNYPVQFKIP